MYRRAVLILCLAAFVSGCASDREQIIMSAGATAGSVLLAGPHGYVAGAIVGSQTYSAIYGEASSANGNRSCRQLRGCVFAGN